MEVKLRYDRKVWVGRKQKDKKKCIYLRFWAIEKKKRKEKKQMNGNWRNPHCGRFKKILAKAPGPIRKEKG